MTNKELIEKLKEHNPNKNLVIYSNDNELMEYDFLGIYENEGQVELHIKEGEKQWHTNGKKRQVNILSVEQ